MTAPDTRQLVEEVTRAVFAHLAELQLRVAVGVSNRHAHLSREDLATLFGLDAMTVYRSVRQPGEFAAVETVSVSGPRGTFGKLRLMGPCRAKTQVELSRTDCFTLGIDAPVTQSGHLDQAGPIDIEGPRGKIHVPHGVMVAARHIHLGPSHAKAFGVADQELVSIQFGGQRGGVLDNFIVRVKDGWVPEIHLDTDEANALGVRSGDLGKLIRK